MKIISVLCVCACAFLSGTVNGAGAEGSEPGNDSRRDAPLILKNPEHMDADTLKGVDLLEFTGGGSRLTPGEADMLVEFIKRGGSLLVVIDEENRTPSYDGGLARVLDHFGLGFTQDTEYLHNCGALAKAGVINQADRELPYSGGRAVSGGTPFAWRLDAQGACAEVFAAWVSVEGGGRVVALAEGMAYLGMGTADAERLSGVFRDPARTTYWGGDARVFIDEVRAWLMGGSDPAPSL